MNLKAFIGCPYCGSCAVERTARHLRCRACTKEVFDNQAAAVGVVMRLPDGRVVMSRRARAPYKGRLDFPGGFVDAGESLEDAAVREIREELGIALVPETLRYLCSGAFVYPYGGVKTYGTDVHFVTDVSAATVAQMRVADDVAAIVLLHPAVVTRAMVSCDSVMKAVRIVAADEAWYTAKRKSAAHCAT